MPNVRRSAPAENRPGARFPDPIDSMAVFALRGCSPHCGRFALLVHEFASATLSPYPDYHRPCLFPSKVVGDDGKVRKVYRDADLATPFEKLKSIPDARRFLKPGVDFETLHDETLHDEAHAESDLAAARRVKEERASSPPSAANGRTWRRRKTPSGLLGALPRTPKYMDTSAKKVANCRAAAAHGLRQSRPIRFRGPPPHRSAAAIHLPPSPRSGLTQESGPRNLIPFQRQLSQLRHRTRARSFRLMSVLETTPSYAQSCIAIVAVGEHVGRAQDFRCTFVRPTLPALMLSAVNACGVV